MGIKKGATSQSMKDYMSNQRKETNQNNRCHKVCKNAATVNLQPNAN